MMYVCSTHRTRGDSACPVKQGLRVGTIDQSIVLHLREILTPELLEKILHDWIMGCRDADRLKERATALQADLATLDSELMTGRFPRPIRCRRTADRLDAIKARERSKADARAQIERLEGVLKATASASSTSVPSPVTPIPDGGWRYKGTGFLGRAFGGWLGIRVPAEPDTFEVVNNTEDALSPSDVDVAETAPVSEGLPSSASTMVPPAGMEGSPSLLSRPMVIDVVGRLEMG